MYLLIALFRVLINIIRVIILIYLRRSNRQQKKKLFCLYSAFQGTQRNWHIRNLNVDVLAGAAAIAYVCDPRSQRSASDGSPS